MSKIKINKLSRATYMSESYSNFIILFVQPFKIIRSNISDKYEKIRISFGEKIKYYRRKKNWTQLDLSMEIEIEARHIQRIEKGGTNTSILVAYAIAKALDVTINDLFDYEI